MDASLKVRPIGTAGYTRSDSSLLRAPILTELDPSQTVTAVLDTPAATDDTPRNAPLLQAALPQAMSQDVLIDPQAREALFRAAIRAGRPIDEAPQEAMLKLKAYTRADRKKRQNDHETVEKTA